MLKIYKKFLKITLIFCFFISFVSFGFCESNYQNNDQGTKTSTLIVQLPLYYVINAYGAVFIHEGSHALIGETMGYDVSGLNVSFNEGETFFKQNFRNNLDATLINLAGPLSNRLMAWQVNKYIDKNEDNMSKSMRSFLGMTYLVNRLDFSWYLWRTYAGVVLPGVEPIESDWNNVGNYIAQKDDTSYYTVLMLFVLVDLWDIYRTRKEIVKNYRRVLGKTTEKNEASKESAFNIGFSERDGKVMLTSRWKF